MKLRDLLARYCARTELSRETEKGYATVVNVFERWLGRPATTQDLVAHANDYLRMRLDGGSIAGDHVHGNRHTARAHRAVLAILLRYAVNGRLLRRRKLRPIRKRAHVPIALLPEELKRFIGYATPEQKAAIYLALDTGYRRNDLFSLDWETNAAQRDDGWIVWLVAGKTGRREIRRIMPRTVAALMAIRRPGSTRMLPRQSKGFTRWREKWHRTGRLAGVDTKRRCLQATRRTGASMLKAQGKDAKKYLGHSTDGVAEAYYYDPRIVGDMPDTPPVFD